MSGTLRSTSIGLDHWAATQASAATLRTVHVYRRAWSSRDELEIEVFSFTNTLRRQSRLNSLSSNNHDGTHLKRADFYA